MDTFYNWLYHWLGWGKFPYTNADPLIGTTKPGQVQPARPKRSLRSLYDEIALLIPYSDVLTWTLQEIADKNPNMIGLLTRLGVINMH